MLLEGIVSQFLKFHAKPNTAGTDDAFVHIPGLVAVLDHCIGEGARLEEATAQQCQRECLLKLYGWFESVLTRGRWSFSNLAVAS